jgi:hypothetical protein
MPLSAHPSPSAAAPEPSSSSSSSGNQAASEPATDPRLARLPQLFRDSRAAGDVHPLEHLVRRYFTGDRA